MTHQNKVTKRLGIESWEHVTKFSFRHKRTKKINFIDIIFDKKKKIYYVFHSLKLIGRRSLRQGEFSAESLAKNYIRKLEG